MILEREIGEEKLGKGSVNHEKKFEGSII